MPPTHLTSLAAPETHRAGVAEQVREVLRRLWEGLRQWVGPVDTPTPVPVPVRVPGADRAPAARRRSATR